MKSWKRRAQRKQQHWSSGSEEGENEEKGNGRIREDNRRRAEASEYIYGKRLLDIQIRKQRRRLFSATAS